MRSGRTFAQCAQFLKRSIRAEIPLYYSTTNYTSSEIEKEDTDVSENGFGRNYYPEPLIAQEIVQKTILLDSKLMSSMSIREQRIVIAS